MNIDNMEFVNDILFELNDKIDCDSLALVKSVLLNKTELYSVKKNNMFSLANVDDCNKKLMKTYILKKNLSGISKNTLKQYIRETNKFLLSINKRAIDVTANDIEKYLLYYKINNNISNTSLHNMKAYINNFFQWMEDEEIINKNPLKKLQKIKTDTIHESAFSKTEEEIIYNSCKNIRDRAIVEFLFSTGIRVSELININISDVDFISKTAVVLGKGNKRRTVCIGDKALYYLKQYIKTRTDDNGALFITKIKPHRRLSSDAVRNILKNIENKTNVSNIHPHRIRATFATRLINMNMNLNQVQSLMGHEKISTTMIYYRGNNKVNYEYDKLVNNM